MDNYLRTKVKLDTRQMREIASLAGVSYPTLYRIISPDFSPVDNRSIESLTKVAAVYGYKPRVRLDFVPVDNGDEN